MKFLSSNGLINKLSGIISRDSVSIIDAIVIYSEESNIEIENLASVIMKDKVLVEKISEEAKRLNLLKKEPEPSNIKAFMNEPV